MVSCIKTQIKLYIYTYIYHKPQGSQLQGTHSQYVLNNHHVHSEHNGHHHNLINAVYKPESIMILFFRFPVGFSSDVGLLT